MSFYDRSQKREVTTTQGELDRATDQMDIPYPSSARLLSCQLGEGYHSAHMAGQVRTSDMRVCRKIIVRVIFKLGMASRLSRVRYNLQSTMNSSVVYGIPCCCGIQHN